MRYGKLGFALGNHLRRSRTLVDKSFQTQQVVDQQQAKVDQLIASIDADRAAIETAETQLDYTAIVAPSDGMDRYPPYTTAVSAQRWVPTLAGSAGDAGVPVSCGQLVQ